MHKAPPPGRGDGALRRTGEIRDQAADVELLLELDVEDVLDVDEAAGAAGVDGFEAGVLLDEAPRLSFR